MTMLLDRGPLATGERPAYAGQMHPQMHPQQPPPPAYWPAQQQQLVQPARQTWLTAALIAGLAGILAGGLAGGAIVGARHNGTPAAATTSTPTTTSATPHVAGLAVPTVPDPVCTEWAGVNERGRSARAAWRETDPTIPAAQWSPEQRRLNDEVAPILFDEARAVRQLASQAQQPALATALNIVATYEEAYARRLAAYTPADLPLWRAASDAATLANSLCQAVIP